MTTDPRLTLTIEYLGFDANGRECEIFLGDAFETHLPSQNRIVLRTPAGEQEAVPGDVLSKDSTGCWVLRLTLTTEDRLFVADGHIRYLQCALDRMEHERDGMEQERDNALLRCTQLEDEASAP